MKDSYLDDDGNSNFTTSSSQGHVVATYYAEEIDTDHRLALEFVWTPTGPAVQRAIYFWHGHQPPEPAWDCKCDPPHKVVYFDHCTVPGPNITLPFSAKSTSGYDPLVLEITTPREAVPACIR